MSVQRNADDHQEPRRPTTPGEHLANGRPFPPLDESVIDGLTDEEWNVFWTAINDA